jgi:hypothetical protein
VRRYKTAVFLEFKDSVKNNFPQLFSTVETLHCNVSTNYKPANSNQEVVFDQILNALSNSFAFGDNNVFLLIGRA